MRAGESGSNCSCVARNSMGRAVPCVLRDGSVAARGRLRAELPANWQSRSEALDVHSPGAIIRPVPPSIVVGGSYLGDPHYYYWSHSPYAFSVLCSRIRKNSDDPLLTGRSVAPLGSHSPPSGPSWACDPRPVGPLG